MKNRVVKKIFAPFTENKLVLSSFLVSLFSIIMMISILVWISYQNKIIITYEQKNTITGNLLDSERPQNIEDNSEQLKNNRVFISFEIPIRSDGVRNCWKQDENSSW